MTGRMEGKVALITGAARGQGRSHAVRLAQEGADIIAVDICKSIRNVPYRGATPEDLEQTVKEVEALGRRIVASEADVRDASEMKELVARGVDELGRIDVAVANAGISIMAAWDKVSQEVWQDTIDINLTGAWNTIQAVAPQLVAQGTGGSIVLISSSAGLKAMPFLSHYTASKHGVTGLGRAFAGELARHNIRVNSVHPCGVETEMISDEANAACIAGLQDNPKIGGMMVNMLDVFSVKPVEISNAVLFLASDESRYITGLAMSVDAGCVQF
ncbi:mycofactocin-coupled SDR family oxidoreductase [Nocardia vaccinii]|uniref:mycofactocin-coupled SDR family oxidoreductase n=1 Tax=Nocardia vaccinii TaxID=1822 RepID=UPI0008369103|nr:mycofactocin-coupled SDR family oxidoreductase [Nocardia vaccinii]